MTVASPTADRTPALVRRRPEEEFRALVDGLVAHPAGPAHLPALLREDAAHFQERGTAATTRMRAWVLRALCLVGLDDAGLPFVLDELENGRDALLIAAAARTLRSHGEPRPEFAPYLLQGLANVVFHDDTVDLDCYEGYADDGTGTTGFAEVLRTLRWLGGAAKAAVPELERLAANEGRALGPAQVAALFDVVSEIRTAAVRAPVRSCCENFAAPRVWEHGRSDPAALAAVGFEDHAGRRRSFGELFLGRPAVVAFFYSRCDNPRKCSLTIAKLAQVQRLLAARGLAAQIRTAGISYDPAWDHPDRLHGYGESRGLRLDDDHGLLRTEGDLGPVRAHFRLGVGFVGSLVNRHQVELYLLDAEGRIAMSFERVGFDPTTVVDAAAALLAPPAAPTQPTSARSDPATPPRPAALAGPPLQAAPARRLGWLGPAAAIATAFFPKCPVCWAAYLSAFGIVGVDRLPYSPWLLPVFAALMLVNLGSLWRRSRARGRYLPFALAAAGALSILGFGGGLGVAHAGLVGVILTAAGSLLNSFDGVRALRALQPSSAA